MSENLAENLFFVLDPIIEDIELHHTETWEAAITLTVYSWNTSIQKDYFKETYYKKKLKELEQQNPNFWQYLTSKDTSFLIKGLLRKRKEFFFEADTRLVKKCFFDDVDNFVVMEDNEEETLHILPQLPPGDE